jgi:hypothetical protein
MRSSCQPLTKVLERFWSYGGLEADSHREAARLVGAADAIRQSIGVVRFKI